MKVHKYQISLYRPIRFYFVDLGAERLVVYICGLFLAWKIEVSTIYKVANDCIILNSLRKWTQRSSLTRLKINIAMICISKNYLKCTRHYLRTYGSHSNFYQDHHNKIQQKWPNWNNNWALRICLLKLAI